MIYQRSAQTSFVGFVAMAVAVLTLNSWLADSDKASGDDSHPALLDPAAHPNRKGPLLNGGTGVYWDSSYFWPGRVLVHEWKQGDERAGNPRSISCLARPSNGPFDDGYYVGGGCVRPHQAEPRSIDEGTWGWDYLGRKLVGPIVDLGYWDGRTAVAIRAHV